MKKLIIFTDLDGTLLDHYTYSFEKALPALTLLKEKNIPLVICSSKTRKEIEYYRRKLDNHHPFITENGGGIFIPKDYFEFTAKNNKNVIPAKAGIQEDMDSRLRTLGMTEKRICSGETRMSNIDTKGNENVIPAKAGIQSIRELDSRLHGNDGLEVFSYQNNYYIISLGAKYSDLRKALLELHSEGFNIKGFGDMTAEELADIANMSIDEARMAKERDFDEPFVFEGDERQSGRLLKAIKDKGFSHTQGGFYHILGDSDKGKAVSILVDLYRKKFGEIMTVAIGDSPNDIPMLQRVDYPIIVQKPDKSYDPRINIPNLTKAEGIGPDGWSKAISGLVLNTSIVIMV